MGDTTKQHSHPPCHMTFMAGVELFADLAREHAINGQLSLAGIEKIRQILKTEPSSVEQYSNLQFERCTADLRLSISKTPRINIYGRIIAQPLEILLQGAAPVMASSQLNNFFHALETILGRAAYESYLERGLKIMDRVSTQWGGKFTYEKLHQDDATQVLQWETYFAVAQFFSNFDVRKDWFNRIMLSDPETPGSGIGPYPFTDFQFKKMMECLIREARHISPTLKKNHPDVFSSRNHNDFKLFAKNIERLETDE